MVGIAAAPWICNRGPWPIRAAHKVGILIPFTIHNGHYWPHSLQVLGFVIDRVSSSGESVSFTSFIPTSAKYKHHTTRASDPVWFHSIII